MKTLRALHADPDRLVVFGSLTCLLLMPIALAL